MKNNWQITNSLCRFSCLLRSFYFCAWCGVLFSEVEVLKSPLWAITILSAAMNRRATYHLGDIDISIRQCARINTGRSEMLARADALYRRPSRRRRNLKVMIARASLSIAWKWRNHPAYVSLFNFYFTVLVYVFRPEFHCIISFPCAKYLSIAT